MNNEPRGKPLASFGLWRGKALGNGENYTNNNLMSLLE